MSNILIISSDCQLGDNQLPQETAVPFSKANHHATIAAMLGIARLVVICADQDSTVGNYRRGIATGAERNGPFDVFASAGVEVFGQTNFARDHVPRIALAPLRLIGAPRAVSDNDDAQYGANCHHPKWALRYYSYQGSIPSADIKNQQVEQPDDAGPNV